MNKISINDRLKSPPCVKRYFMMLELIIAIGIMAIALFPLAYGLRQEGLNVQALYYRAVAEEILDGQREILAAGAWRDYSNSEASYNIKNKAYESLPAGDLKLQLIGLDNGKVKIILSWKSLYFKGIGEIRKEAVVTR